MDILEIEQHKLVLKRAKSLMKVAFDSDKQYLNNIISNSKGIIDNFNKENLTVLDVSNIERGRWVFSTNALIHNKYCKPIIEKMTIEFPPEDECFCKEHYQYDEYLSEYIWQVDDFCDKCKKEYDKQCKEEEDFIRKKDIIIKEFSEAIKNNMWDEDLRLRCILFRRQIRNRHKLNPLERALDETIKIEIIVDFYNKNKELITKYL